MEERYYRQAKKEVRKKKRFYRHLAAFIIINFFIFFINQMVDPYDPWFLFSLSSWSVALAFHYINVFGLPGSRALSKEWENKEIEKEIYKLKKTDNLKYNQPIDHNITIPDEELELNDFKKLRKEWDDSDLV